MTQIKPAIALVLIAFLIIGGTYVIIAKQEQAQLESILQKELKAQLTRQSQSLVNKINQYRRNVLFLSETPPILGIARASESAGIDPVDHATLKQWESRLSKIFVAYIKSNVNVKQVRFIGIAHHGKELVRVEQNNKRIVIVPYSKLQSKGATPYFKETIRLSRGKTYVSEINLNREFGRVEKPSWPTLRISTPTFDAQGNLFGLIVVNIDAQNILRNIAPTIGENSTNYLFNQRGDYLFHPDPSKTFASDKGTSWRWTNEFKPLTKPGKSYNLERYEAPEGIVYAIKKKLVFGSGMNAAESMTFVVTQSQSVLNTAIQKAAIKTTLLLAGVLGVILGVFFILYVQRRKLDRQEINMGAILNSTEDMIISRRLDESINLWNTAAEPLFNKRFKFNKTKRYSFHDLQFTPEFLAKDNAALALISKGELAGRFDFEIHNDHQQNISLSVHSSAIKDKNNNLIGFVSVFHNVNLEREAQKGAATLNQVLEKQINARTKEIKRMNALQKAIVNDAAYAIIATDKEGVVTLFNPAAEQMLDYPAADIIGKKTPALWHDPEEVAARAIAFSEELNEPLSPGFDVFVAKSRKGLLNQDEWRYIRRDGKKIPVMLGISMLLDENGVDVEGYIGIASDISVQKDTEKELLLLRDELTAAAEIAELGVWSWFPANNNLEWNDQMYAMYDQPLSLRKKGLLFKHWSERLHPEDAEKTISALMDAIEGRGEYHPMFRIVLRDGRMRYIQAGAKMEHDLEGNVLRVTGFNRDITAQHNYELLLRQAKEKSDAANIAKSAFLANMSHEIRTPMNAIIGFLQLLQKGHLDETQQDYLSKLDISSKVLLSIVNDILDFSKIESGKLELNYQPLQLEHIIMKLSPILSVNIGKKELEVLFDIDKDLYLPVLGDETRLQQVLLNLSSNALKFTERGEVIIGLKKTQQQKNKITVNFTVKDTGIGISPEQSKRVFDSFAQAEVGTTRKYGGTGLGLAISQKLVHLMGGELLLKSKLGEGSLFYFSLEFELAPQKKTPLMPNYGMQSLKCLLVDDNNEARIILSETLSSFGWTVEQATNGNEALSKVIDSQSTQPFDVIFMDWQMPELNGWEASQRIRALDMKERSPIIIMVTAYHTDMIAQHRQKIPSIIDAVLVKPVTPSTIFDSVANICVPLNKKVVKENLSTTKTNVRLLDTHILVVEDNPSNQMVAHDLLANEGALVTVADNGKAAIEAINNAEPLFDVVLMDIQMPGMDGYEATRNIRERYDSKQLPIIAMTANALLDHQEKAISAKMNGFISKPFNLDDLVTLIQEQLSKETPKSSKIKIKTAPPSVVNIFNTSAAIDRFGGNEQVFYKALANFIIDVNRALDHLPKALDDSFDEVCATIHSLKGLTSTFGADVFHEKAVETYKRLNQATQPTKSTWTKMRRALISSGQEALAEGARLLTSLELETAQKTNSSAHDSSSFQKKLALLLDYLKTNNMEALKIYEQLKHEHTENTSDAFVKLGQSIDQLDFLKATNYCQHLINTVLGGKK